MHINFHVNIHIPHIHSERDIFIFMKETTCYPFLVRGGDVDEFNAMLHPSNPTVNDSQCVMLYCSFFMWFSVNKNKNDVYDVE